MNLIFDINLCADVLVVATNVKPMINYTTRFGKADTRRDIIIIDKEYTHDIISQ